MKYQGLSIIADPSWQDSKAGIHPGSHVIRVYYLVGSELLRAEAGNIKTGSAVLANTGVCRGQSDCHVSKEEQRGLNIKHPFINEAVSGTEEKGRGSLGKVCRNSGSCISS